MSNDIEGHSYMGLIVLVKSAEDPNSVTTPIREAIEALGAKVVYSTLSWAPLVIEKKLRHWKPRETKPQ